MTVHDFLKELGGTTKVSRAIGIPLTTVSEWGLRNNIPAWRMGKLAEYAVSQGKPIPADFGPPNPKARNVAA